MPETEVLVINTGPMLALIAGYGDLSLLKHVYKRVLVHVGNNKQNAVSRGLFKPESY